MSRRAKETTRREQQLGDSTQRQPSQFERVEAHLQHRAEQELGQTQVRGRGRGRDRGRGGEASEPLSEHQQEASIKASTGCFKSDM